LRLAGGSRGQPARCSQLPSEPGSCGPDQVDADAGKAPEKKFKAAPSKSEK
jgi:hypothetical protein